MKKALETNEKLRIELGFTGVCSQNHHYAPLLRRPVFKGNYIICLFYKPWQGIVFLQMTPIFVSLEKKPSTKDRHPSKIEFKKIADLIANVLKNLSEQKTLDVEVSQRTCMEVRSLCERFPIY